MDTVELFQRLSVALAVGLLIGIERGWQERREAEGERAAGLRTLALLGLLGGVCGAIALSLGDPVAQAILIGLAFVIASLIVAFYRYRENVHDGNYGATTVLAAMLAFALGTLAVLGDIRVAAGTAVAVTVLLALKAALHEWLQRLTWQELRSGLVLLAMTFILLPVLPNRSVDPWGALNPHELWLMTIMLAVISFVGYVATRIAGARRGVVIAGISGGLVASTAVTLDMARRARDTPAEAPMFMAGALLAGATMLLRILVVVAAFNAPLLMYLTAPLLAGVAILAAAAVRNVGTDAIWPSAAAAAASPSEQDRASVSADGPGDDTQRPEADLANPFELREVLRFGALLAVVMVLAKLSTSAAGATGAFVVAAISGTVDVDAVTLSMSRLAPESLSLERAAVAIAIAAAVNTLAKAGYCWGIAGWRNATSFLAPSAIAVAAGAAILAVTLML